MESLTPQQCPKCGKVLLYRQQQPECLWVCRYCDAHVLDYELERKEEAVRHFIESCRECKRTITQCRCPDRNKEQRWGLCEKCRDKGVVDDDAVSNDQPPTLRERAWELLKFYRAGMGGGESHEMVTRIENRLKAVQVDKQNWIEEKIDEWADYHEEIHNNAITDLFKRIRRSHEPA